MVHFPARHVCLPDFILPFHKATSSASVTCQSFIHRQMIDAESVLRCRLEAKSGYSPYAPWSCNMNPNICLKNHPNVRKIYCTWSIWVVHSVECVKIMNVRNHVFWFHIGDLRAEILETMFQPAGEGWVNWWKLCFDGGNRQLHSFSAWYLKDLRMNFCSILRVYPNLFEISWDCLSLFYIPLL